MLITEHFQLKEFQCRSGEAYPQEWIKLRLKPLCEALEKIRKALGCPLRITSGYRSKTWNERLRQEAMRIGKKLPAKNSMHIQGKGVDFVPVNCKKTKHEILKTIENLINRDDIPQGGLSVYSDGHVHYDQRGFIARW